VLDRSTWLPALEPATETRQFQFTTSNAGGTEAAGLYREAAKLLVRDREGWGKVVDEVVLRGWDSGQGRDAAFVAANEKALGLVRRASALPSCQFVAVQTATLFSIPPESWPNLLDLVTPLAASARDRMSRGDVNGAWDEIAVVFRMARHWSGPVPLVVANSGLYAERLGLSLALAWAADPRQTPESLARALDS
jgi:hypothetical protein